MSGRALALRTAVAGVLILLIALPSAALASSTAEIADNGNGPFVRVNGDDGINEITLNLAGGVYTASDTSGITAGFGCTQLGADVTCPGEVAGVKLRAAINGFDGGDTILGSSGPDRINGGPGPDDLDGRDGDDIIDSGTGGIDLDLCLDTPPFRCYDDLTGGAAGVNPGWDTLTYYTRTGRVTTDLRPGRSFATDDDGTVDGVNSIEAVVGGAAADELIGGLGPDYFNGGPGNAADTICGGLGKDTVDYSDKTAAVTVTLDGVLDTDQDIIASNPDVSVGARQDCRPVRKISGGGVGNGLPCTAPNVQGCPSDLKRDCTPNDGVAGENDCIGEDIENVVGSPHDDILIGNDPDPLYGQGPRVEPAGENVLDGGGGDDTLDGRLGADLFKGGDGNDAVSYEGRTDDITASLDGSANDGSALDRNPANNLSDEISHVEDLIGGDGDDHLKGDEHANVLLGGPGDDLIQGYDGADDLGGDGGDDTLEGGQDGDAMNGGPGDDLLFGGFGNDAYDGGEGVDTADFSDATTPVSVTINGAADDGRASEGDNVAATIESLIGGIDDDNLNANDGDGTLEGGGGNDLLNGGLGADVLIGGPGVDVAAYGGHPGPVNVDLAVPGGDGLAGENDDVTGDVEAIGGSVFDDTLSGDAKLNTINGGPGDDTITGAEGNDFLAGGLGNDTVTGDAGDDIVDGAEGEDRLNGSAGDDTLRGFTGDDLLDGGAGADTMTGGDGVDTVTYASRTADVVVDTLGAPDDGEQGENDQVRTDIESVRTGSGDDTIDIADGATGAASCGAGSDTVKADPSDEIGAGCESSGVSQAGICVTTPRSVRMSRSGVVTLRLTCAFNARGTVQLRSAGRVRPRKGAALRRLNLGRKSFTGRLGRVTVRVKVSQSARAVIQRRKRLRVEATLAVRRDAANAAMRTRKTKLTLRTSG